MIEKDKAATIVAVIGTAILFVLVSWGILVSITNGTTYSSEPTTTNILNAIILLLYSSSLWIRGDAKYWIQIIIFSITASLTTFYSTDLFSITGEILLLAPFCLCRIYRIKKKKLIIFVISSISILIMIKTLSSINNSFFEPRAFFFYLIFLAIIYTLFVLFLLETYSISKVHAHNIQKVCDEQRVFTEIGKTIYTDIYHDFNGHRLIDLLQLIQTFNKLKDYNNANECIGDLKNEIELYNNKFYSIRKEVVNCQKRLPEIISVKDFFTGYRFKNYDIELAISNSPELLLPKYDLIGIIDPILSNAKDFMINRLSINVINDNKYLSIYIENDGPPIGEKWRTNMGSIDMSMFQPSFTTKKYGTGWGMWSAITKANKNKATISATSNELKTKFTIKIPLYKRG